jgi:predicted GIY-YIG superfamily endonuclease
MTEQLERMKAMIYVLIDPRTNEVCYVGKSNDVERRYNDHLHNPNSKKMEQWIKELAQIRLKPLLKVIEVIEATDPLEILACEAYWISTYLAKSAPLLNSQGTTKKGEEPSSKPDTVTYYPLPPAPHPFTEQEKRNLEQVSQRLALRHQRDEYLLSRLPELDIVLDKSIPAWQIRYTNGRRPEKLLCSLERFNVSGLPS